MYLFRKEWHDEWQRHIQRHIWSLQGIEYILIFPRHNLLLLSCCSPQLSNLSRMRASCTWRWPTWPPPSTPRWSHLRTFSRYWQKNQVAFKKANHYQIIGYELILQIKQRSVFKWYYHITRNFCQHWHAWRGNIFIHIHSLFLDIIYVSAQWH